MRPTLNSVRFAQFFGRFFGLYLLYVAVAILGRLLEDTFQISGLMPTDERQDPTMLAMASITLLSFIWTLVSGSFLLALLARRGFGIRSFLSLTRTVELIVIETVRTIAATLIRLPLLVLPGVFEWIRLTPIPYLVILDSNYQLGRVDALVRARKFFSRHKWRVLLLLIPSALILILEISTTGASADEIPLWQALAQHPWQHVGSILGFAMAHLICDSFVLSRYQIAMQDKA